MADEEKDDLNSLFDLESPNFDDPIDRKQSQEILTRALPPSGIYQTNPDEFGPLNVITSAKDFDEPRRMIILSGRFTGTFKGKTVTAFVRNIKLSPDRRPAKEFKDGKPTGELLDKDDQPSILWAKAEGVYAKQYGENGTPKQAVIDFLATGQYKVKIRAYNGELYVREILPLRGR